MSSLRRYGVSRFLEYSPWWHYSRPYWVGWLGGLVDIVQHMATHYGIDLDAAIEEKMAYMRGAAENETRSLNRRHVKAGTAED